MKLAVYEHVDARCLGMVHQIEHQLVWPAMGWQGSQEIPGSLLDKALDEQISLATV